MRAEADARARRALAEIRAMVLFDLVGDCELRIPLEANSDPASMRSSPTRPRSAPAARRRSRARPAGFGDDHLPFLEAGVPAVDLIDFEYGPGPAPGAYWHTPEDTLDKVCAESLDAVGEAALARDPPDPLSLDFLSVDASGSPWTT